MKLHPFVVHMPIALLLVGGLTGLASGRKAELVTVSWWTWFIGTLASIGSSISGLVGHQPYEGTHLSGHIEQHLVLGVSTSIGAIIIALARRHSRRKGDDFIRRGVPYRLLPLSVALLCVVTGWSGGRLVYDHGIGVALPAECGPVPTPKLSHRQAP